MIALVSISAIAGVLSLAWALVRRVDQCADLREYLAVARINSERAYQDLSRVEKLYRDQVATTTSLARVAMESGESDDPFVLFDSMLERWKSGATETTHDLRNDGKLRNGTRAATEPGNAHDGTAAIEIVHDDDDDDERMQTANPETPTAIAAANKRAGTVGAGNE